MTLKRFPWRIFWLSLITQLATFNFLYGVYCLLTSQLWDGTIILLGTSASLFSTLIFIKPVYFLAVSLKEQKADLHREREETQAFLSSIQEAVVTFSLDKKILFFNTRFASLFVGSAKNNRTKSFENVFANVELIATVNDVINTGKSKNITLTLPTLLDSQSRYFNINVTPVKKRKISKKQNKLELNLLEMLPMNCGLH